MDGMKVRLIESNVGGQFKRTPDPQWIAIERAVRGLASLPGRVDLYEHTDDGIVIMISGGPGVYALDVLIGQTEAAMLVSRSSGNESVIEVFGNEYRADQVVHDLDLAIRLVKELIDHNRFADTQDMIRVLF
jgi:hypothetical protein